MRKIKKFDSFISEKFDLAEPEVKPAKPEIETRPEITEPKVPSLIPDETEQDSPAKAELPKASAEDVAQVFIELINKSGDDIKKYVELK